MHFASDWSMCLHQPNRTQRLAQTSTVLNANFDLTEIPMLKLECDFPKSATFYPAIGIRV